MAVQSFERPFDALASCHERIHEMLSALEALCRDLGASGASAEARAAAKSIMRYFDGAGSLHHEDEDHDLFPLLRRRAADEQRVEICAVIEELEREHETLERQWIRLREALAAVVRGKTRLDPEDVVRFAWLYRRHMAREAAALLPFARQALTNEEQAALGSRMAARRNTASAQA